MGCVGDNYTQRMLFHINLKMRATGILVKGKKGHVLKTENHRKTAEALMKEGTAAARGASYGGL